VWLAINVRRNIVRTGHFMTDYGAELLRRQLADLAKNPIDLVSVGLEEDDVFHWEIMIMGPDGTLYEGGFFKARLVFPSDFPNMPPVSAHRIICAKPMSLLEFSIRQV
jgi:ubiquitin-protein ligase